MKTPRHYVQFDQGYLHYQRRKQRRRDIRDAIIFGLLVTLMAGIFLFTTLHAI